MHLVEFWALAQIIAIDALMAGDNAIVVGMAAASVPAENRRKVVFLGTLAATGLRVLFALVAVRLLEVVGLTLAGGLLLLYVAYKMYREISGTEGDVNHAATSTESSVTAAVWTIVLADVSMSLDNVLAVAGAANGHTGVLVIGLAVSVVLMAVAAVAIASLIQRHRWLAWIGLMMVTYVALTMIFRGGTEVAAAIASLR